MQSNRFQIQPVRCPTPKSVKVHARTDNPKQSDDAKNVCDHRTFDLDERRIRFGFWVAVFRIIAMLFWTYALIYMCMQFYSYLQ